ncbi:hypothetical protein GCM10009545_04990 [Saccharopolyspora thermophila]|uniref:Uncharacterized protein n=1 Tax=Saccharopolyspora thermophila TaxID=89367 RepID=A0ABN1BUW0_9PSEU
MGGDLAVRAARGLAEAPQLAAQSPTVHGRTLTHRAPRRKRFGTFSPERGSHNAIEAASIETGY